MAQAVETIVDIDGKKIKDFISLKLSQGIYAHHEFRLECFAEALGPNTDVVFKESTELIGSPLRLQVTSVTGQSQLTFSGIITEVAAACNNGHPESIVIKGASPTILLDQAPQYRSWERKSVNKMVKEVLGQFPGDWLMHRIEALYKDTIYYEVQYNETAWQFINRLAGRFGEWLYYDGQKLVLAAPGDARVDITYGAQLSSFVQGIELKPGKLQGLAYDYVSNMRYESLVENIAANEGHIEAGAKALMKSEELFGTPATYWEYHPIKNKKQLDKVMSIRAAIQNSDIVRMKGSSDLPGLRPGDAIAVKKDEAVSDFRIISIEHSWDGIGNYSNEFVSIPASVKKPPVKRMKPPYCATRSAEVVDNYDEGELGRVRVRFGWMSETERTPWIRIVTPYTGNGNGMYMIPEIGAEVLVAFVDGNPVLPYVIGVVNNGGAKTMYGNARNDIKAIQTRSGIKILMNDREGSFFVEDKNGNTLKLDGQGTVTIIAKDTLEFTSGQSKIVFDKDGQIKISGRVVEIDTTEDIKIRSASKVEVQGGKITLN